jgi:hypothetical protein
VSGASGDGANGGDACFTVADEECEASDASQALQTSQTPTD